MKKMIILALALVSATAFAQIQNSNLDLHHQAAIENAIEQKCGFMSDLTQIQFVEETIRIDQGVIDKNFSVTLIGTQKMDQVLFDNYIINVKSMYFDNYDHQTKNWGSYVVESVSCTMIN